MKTYTWVNQDRPLGFQIQRHIDAINAPKPGFEKALRDLLRAWTEYPQAHESRYESPIGEDPYTREGWAMIGEGINRLLSCETGRLDPGTINSIIFRNFEEQGYNMDIGEWEPHPGKKED